MFPENICDVATLCDDLCNLQDVWCI